MTGGVRLGMDQFIDRSGFMVKQKHVCIIGAGVSGLAAGKAFSTRGHRVTIIERSGDLGGVWDPDRKSVV